MARGLIRFLATSLAALALLPAGSARAETEEVRGMAEAFRKLWANPDAKDQKSAAISTSLFGNIVRFHLPRGFVPASIQRSPQAYIAEYVPDGESLTDWTRMITVVAFGGAAAAPITLDQLAERFNLAGKCEPSLFQNLGTRPKVGDAEVLVVGIGCGKSPTPAGERGEQAFIAFLRDDKNIYTVQVATRGKTWEAGAPPIGLEEADARLAAVGPLLVCAGPDTAGCKDAWAIGNMVPPK